MAVDAPSGYHQLTVAIVSQEKLAFQGPDAIKWTYTVMPFGPTNGPATFISMIYDLDSQWKALATSVGITVGDDTDTRIIVDDIVSHGPTIDISLLYGMSTEDMQGIPSFPEPQEELHLPGAF
jgi:hypothetical protein